MEFQEITWDYKVEELDSRAIDCVWNGMTLTDDVLAAMGTSNPYCTNYQTLVYPADRAAEFEGLTSLEGLNIAVESGSAGEDAAVALGATTVPVQAQSNALMEVAAGTSDAAVIDVLMAAEMTGEGTSYADLIYSLNLNEAQDLPSEEYGVGFRHRAGGGYHLRPAGRRDPGVSFFPCGSSKSRVRSARSAFRRLSPSTTLTLRGRYHD